MATYVMVEDAILKIRRRPFSILSQQIDEVEKSWFKAAADCDLEKLKVLHSLDINLINRKYAAIHWAVKKARDDVIRWLYQREADTNIKTNGGYTPLHVAAMQGKEIIIRNLVQYYEVDIDIRDYSGRKARHYLSQDSSISIQRALQVSPSVLDIDIQSVNPLAVKISTPPPKTSMPCVTKDNTSEHHNMQEENHRRKKKRTLSISQSFKKGRKILIEKRNHSNEKSDSPISSPRRQRKSASTNDLLKHHQNHHHVDQSFDENKSMIVEHNNNSYILIGESLSSTTTATTENMINGYAGFISDNKYHRKLPQITDLHEQDQQWGINTWV